LIAFEAFSQSLAKAVKKVVVADELQIEPSEVPTAR
jgi:hypothetical protein